MTDLLDLLSRCESYPERVFALAAHCAFPDLEAQVEVGGYRADFGRMDHGILIEIDGKAYHGSPEQMARDRQRDERIGRFGWRILRFHAREVIQDVTRCISEIAAIPEPLPFDEV